MTKMVDIHELIYDFDTSENTFAEVFASNTMVDLLVNLHGSGLTLSEGDVEELTAVVHHYLTKVKAQ